MRRWWRLARVLLRREVDDGGAWVLLRGDGGPWDAVGVVVGVVV